LKSKTKKKIENKINFENGYFMTKRNIKIYFQSYIIENAKANVFLCHGYGAHSPVEEDPMDYTVHLRAKLLQSFNVFAIDFEGHGRSGNLPGFLPSFSTAIDDIEFFLTEYVLKKFPDLKIFLYGESMGGAFAIQTSFRKLPYIHGLLLGAPMTRVGEKMKPPSWQIPIFRFVAYYLPSYALIPNKIADNAFHLKERAEKSKSDPLCYTGSLRLGVAEQILTTCEDIEKNLENVETPFFYFPWR